jgi:hypothetical protein
MKKGTYQTIAGWPMMTLTAGASTRGREKCAEFCKIVGKIQFERSGRFAQRNIVQRINIR